MLPKAPLTSHCMMSGPKLMTTLLWLSGSLGPFCISVYSCYLFLISSASIKFLMFLSFIMPIFTSNIFLISPIFLKISLVFSVLLFSSISLHWSLKAFLYHLAILWNSVVSWVYLSFCPLPFASLFSAICKASSDNHCAFLRFFLRWFWSLPPAECYKPPSIVLQALCLPDLIPWICSSPPL